MTQRKNGGSPSSRQDAKTTPALKQDSVGDQSRTQQDLNEIRRQIAQYIGVVFEQDDLVEVRQILPARPRLKKVRRPTRSSWHNAADLANLVESLAVDNRRGTDIYVGVLPRRAAGCGVNAKDCKPDRLCGKCDECAVQSQVLVADFDRVEVDEALRRWRAAGLPGPTLTIASGHGAHLYLSVDEPIAPDVFRDHQQRLIALLGSDKSIHNPGRIMRLPGFMNVKEPDDPKPCRIIDEESDSAVIVELRDLASLLPPAAANPVEQASHSVPSKTGEVQTCLKSMLSIWPRAVENDGSNRLFGVACRAVEHNLADEQAIQAIRGYEKVAPFPRQYTDAEITLRLRDAEKKVERGSGLKDRRRGPRVSVSEVGGVELECRPIDLNGVLKAEVTAKVGDKVIHRDRVDYSSDRSRQKFVHKVCRLAPDIQPEALTVELLRKSTELREQADKGEDGEQDICSPFVKSSTHLAETIIHPVQGTLVFAIFDCASRRVRYGNQVEGDGVAIRPPNAGAAALCTWGFGSREGAVLLPTSVEEYGSDANLIEEVRGFIHRYVELPGDFESVATYYVMFTWLYDRFDEVAYMRFMNAEFGRGKSRALETVGSICYRPMFLGGSSSAAAMRRLIDLFGGTLIGDEQDAKGDSDMTATYTKILNQGFQRGRPLIVCETGEREAWKPRKFSIFGPKILATRKRLADDATESRCLTIPIEQRTRADIPKNLPRLRFDQEAVRLRNKLLLWRFRNFYKATLNPALEIPGVEDRLNQIAVPLLSIVSDETVQRSIVGMLRGLQADIQQTKSETWAGWLVDFLADRWSRDTEDIPVGDACTVMNARMAEEAGVELDKLRKPLTAHKIGRIARDELRLKTYRRGGVCRVKYDPIRLAELRSRYIVGDPPAESPESPDESKSCAQDVGSAAVLVEQDLQDFVQDIPKDSAQASAPNPSIELEDQRIPGHFTPDEYRRYCLKQAELHVASNPALAAEYRERAAKIK